jgi:hypothetical protein
MAPAILGAVALTLALRVIPALVRAEIVLCFVNIAGIVCYNIFLLAVGKSLTHVIPALAITLALAISEAQTIAEVVFCLINVARVLLVSTERISMADILVAVSITLALGGRITKACTKSIPALIYVAVLDFVGAVGGSPALILEAEAVAFALCVLPA